MKKIIILILLSNFSISMFSQNNVSSNSKHSQIFSLSPISKKVDKVNGLVFGVGHVENKNIESQTINGLNIEANPAPIAGALISFIAIMHLPDVIKNKPWKSTDTINTVSYTHLDVYKRQIHCSVGVFKFFELFNRIFKIQYQIFNRLNFFGFFKNYFGVISKKCIHREHKMIA